MHEKSYLLKKKNTKGNALFFQENYNDKKASNNIKI